MTILYRSTKLKSANISELYVWDKTAKFNSAKFSGYTVAFLVHFPIQSLQGTKLEQDLCFSVHIHTLEFYILTAVWGLYMCESMYIHVCTSELHVYQFSGNLNSIFGLIPHTHYL